MGRSEENRSGKIKMYQEKSVTWEELKVGVSRRESTSGLTAFFAKGASL